MKNNYQYNKQTTNPMDHTTLLGYFVEEVFFLQLMPYLSMSSLSNLASTCKKLRGMFMKFASQEWRIGPYIMYRYQKYVSDSLIEKINFMSENMEESFILQAPPSAGKTITSLRVAVETAKTGINWMILVPPKALNTWTDEICHAFPELVDRNNPAESFFILPATRSLKTHAAYIKNLHLRNEEMSPINKIIVCTSITYKKRRVENMIEIGHVIIDEAHTRNDWEKMLDKDYFRDSLGFRRVIYLSAEDLIKKVPDPTRRYILKRQALEGSIPKCTAQYLVFGEPRNHPLGMENRFDDFELNSLGILNRIYDCLKEIEEENEDEITKTVIFVPGGDAYDKFEDYFTKIPQFKDYKIFFFKQSTKIIKRFEDHSNKSLLLISHNNSESINIDADYGIVVYPEWVNPLRYTQMASRILRITNVKSSVKIFNITNNGLGLHRSLFYFSLLNVDIKNLGLNPEDIRDSHLNAVFGMLRVTKIPLDKLEPIDILVLILGQEKSMYEKWFKEKHYLDEGFVEDFLSLTPYT